MKVTAPLQRGGVERDCESAAALSTNANAAIPSSSGMIRPDAAASALPPPHLRLSEPEPLTAREPRASIASEDAASRPVSDFGQAKFDRIAKRMFDIVGATICLAALSPILLAASLLVAATSGWPVFYLQNRVGQGGHIFRMWKFRSMRKDAEQTTGPIWACDKDARCTKIGRILRRTNIDELPQLWNVLRGEMSLVGPRPERPIFVDQFRQTVPNYDDRHDAPAGMTGWAQVHGWRGRTSIHKRVEYDLDYIRRWSFWLDLRIMLMTVQHVLFKRTQWKSSNLGESADSALPVEESSGVVQGS